MNTTTILVSAATRAAVLMVLAELYLLLHWQQMVLHWTGLLMQIVLMVLAAARVALVPAEDGTPDWTVDASSSNGTCSCSSCTSSLSAEDDTTQ